jgi:hypothetical protein
MKGKMMNINAYTEFQNIKVGEKFIDADGFEYEKVSAEKARHFDARYINGHMDYEYSADDRLRVQSA